MGRSSVSIEMGLRCTHKAARSNPRLLFMPSETAVGAETAGINPASRRGERRFDRRLAARRAVITLAAALAVSPFLARLPALPAAEPASRPERIDPDGIKGSLVICGGGRLPDS